MTAASRVHSAGEEGTKSPADEESPPPIGDDAHPPEKKAETPFLQPAKGRDLQRILEFGRRLSTAPTRLLMLDYDGTLAPFRVERTEAVPYPGVVESISLAIASGTRVVVISGRSAQEVSQLLGLTPPPEIWGCHGWERLAGGKVERFPLTGKQNEGLTRAWHLLKKEGLEARLERKHGSLALHWRGADVLEKAGVKAVGVRAMQPAAKEGLALKWFDGGMELRALGRDKGVVVKQLIEEVGVEAAVAYLGDDLTDEDAFKALGENGLTVLVREELRETVAEVWLRPPEELLMFLKLWGTG